MGQVLLEILLIPLKYALWLAPLGIVVLTYLYTRSQAAAVLAMVAFYAILIAAL